jgi:hypothetical protein
MVAVLLVLVPSRMNAGVRHVLPLYGMLALLAASAVVRAFQAAGRRALAPAAGLLLALVVAAPLRAWPDCLASFGVLAGRDPGGVLMGSDLDWGQDLLRLETALARRNVPQLWIAYLGGADLCRHRLPPMRWLRPHQPVTGWIAISETYRRGIAGWYSRNGDPCDPAQMTREAPPDPAQYSWLDAYQPVERVGTSILLYHVPE